MSGHYKKFKNICRLCGDESYELIRLHIRQPKQRSLKDLIKKYIGIKVTPNDGLPEQICGPCIAKLDETSDFIDKCVKAQKLLKDIVADCDEKEDTDCDEEEDYEIKQEPYEGETPLCAESIVSTILHKDCDKTVSPSLENSNSNSSDQPNILEKCTVMSIDDDISHTGIGDSSTEEVLNDNEENESEQQPTDSAKYECNQCTKAYPLRRSLRSHQRRVHEKSMEKCPKCDKVLNSHYLWQYHILVHNDERPHSCNDCQKTFKTKQEAAKHMKTHIPIEDRYNFSCEICGKRFTNKGNLSTHIKLHSDERPFVCDECGKSFRHKGSLDDHQLAHKGEKAFVCSICGKG